MTKSKTAAELYDDFIKLEWQDLFREEVHVKLDNGARYVPNSGARGVWLLRKDVNAFEEACRAWDGPVDEPPGSSGGYDRIVDQVGVKYTWEWFLVDPSRPWASAVPKNVRARIEADLARRSGNAVSRAQARKAEEEDRIKDEDEAAIAALNARFAEQGKPPLDDKQRAHVLEARRSRRERAS